MSEQVPPADDLAAVRDQIRVLERREAELKAIILSDNSARVGNWFLAEVVTITQQRTDLKELRKMHPALIEEYTFPIAITKVELRVVDDETGEISARPKRKAE